MPTLYRNDLNDTVEILIQGSEGRVYVRDQNGREYWCQRDALIPVDSETRSTAASPADRFAEDMKAECSRAVSLHGDFHSLHEAYGVISEEFNREFWEIVCMKADKRDKSAMREELVQVAAMCLKTALKFC